MELKEDAVVNSLHSLSEFRWIDKEVGTSSKNIMEGYY